MEAPLKIYSQTGSVYSVSPKLAYVKGEYLSLPDTIAAESPDLSIAVGTLTKC